MNIDWTVITVIASVVFMIVGSAYFVYYAMKHVEEDKTDDS